MVGDLLPLLYTYGRFSFKKLITLFVLNVSNLYYCDFYFIELFTKAQGHAMTIHITLGLGGGEVVPQHIVHD